MIDALWILLIAAIAITVTTIFVGAWMIVLAKLVGWLFDRGWL